MLIEAPNQKKTYMDFSSSLEDLVKQGWAAVHFTAEHWFAFINVFFLYFNYKNNEIASKIILLLYEAIVPV